MVVDHGVQVGDAGARLVVGTFGQAGGGALVEIALLASHDAVPATVGDVAELRHVDVKHRARMIVLVAAQRLPGDPVDV
jgi:hypothetical protein